MKPWEQYLSDDDRAVIKRAKFGRRIGFGSNPAIIVIDVQKFMIGDVDAPMDWPSNSGAGGHSAIPHIQAVLREARAQHVPCFFAAFEIDPSGKDMGVYRRKRDLLDTENWCLAGSVGAELLPQMEIADDDIVFVKKKAERLSWHPASWLPNRTRDRHGDHNGRLDEQLRASHRIRCIILQFPNDGSTRRSVRPHSNFTRHFFV